MKEVSAGIILFRRTPKIKYLLLYRKAHEVNGVKYSEAWVFPRGNIEANETELEAALRELKEETGFAEVTIIPGFKEKISWFYRKAGKNIYKEVVYFLGETKQEKVKLSYEHDGYAWLSYEEALAKLKFKNVKDVLKKANEYLEKICKSKNI